MPTEPRDQVDRSRGRPPLGDGDSIRRTFRLSPTTDVELARRAASLGICRSLYIRQALVREFKREDREHRRNDRRGLTTDDWSPDPTTKTGQNLVDRA